MNIKRGPLILLVSGLILISLAQSSLAAGQGFWVSRGGRDDCSSFSLGYAWQCFALEIGFLNDVDYYNDTDYFGSWPGDYQLLGVEQRTSTGGLDLLYLFDPSDRFLFYCGHGLYYHELGQTVEETGTGKKYNKYLSMKMMPAHSMGFKYKWAKLQFGVGYHSIRGVNGHIGFVF
ncbi:MAG: hypothetical protein GX081_07810 [Firmicutes bacterium]|nr:hypothetical protein [Bacillota bacterium]